MSTISAPVGHLITAALMDSKNFNILFKHLCAELKVISNLSHLSKTFLVTYKYHKAIKKAFSGVIFSRPSLWVGKKLVSLKISKNINNDTLKAEINQQFAPLTYSFICCSSLHSKMKLKFSFRIAMNNTFYIFLYSNSFCSKYLFFI